MIHFRLLLHIKSTHTCRDVQIINVGTGFVFFYSFFDIVFSEYCSTWTRTPTMSSDVVAHSSTEDRHTVDDEAYEPTYAEAFPPLPAANATDRGEPTSQAPAPQWKKLSLKTSTVTQVRGLTF